ncbi:unnamed protein product [Ixodes hexagonus]
MQNKRVILKFRPGTDGEPHPQHFGVETCTTPSQIPDGNVLIRNLYLSIDPALRCRMNDHTGVHYLSPWAIGECIDGLGGVGVIEESRFEGLSKGDVVCRALSWPWQIYFDTQGDTLEKVDVKSLDGDVSLVLSCLGLTGLTALLGLREKGGIKPGAGQACVVSAAAGSCGSLAGQIAKLEGCARAVGICGSQEKCKFLLETLKFDAAINYKTEDVDKRIQETCPNGVQVYFDNVGGSISDSVIRHMTPGSNVVLCGQISVYNKDVPYPPPVGPGVQEIMDERHIKRERFLVIRYEEKFQESLAQLSEWLKGGKLLVQRTVEKGLENAPKAFISMMNGGNIGKQMVLVSDF